MDKIQRDTMFAGLSDHDMGKAIAMEMRRRGMYGCFFMFPNNGNGVFVSTSPKNTLAEYPISVQLAIFSECAKLSVEGKRTSLNGEVEIKMTPENNWIN